MMKSSQTFRERKGLVQGWWESSRQPRGLGMCSQKFFTLIPRKHVGSAVVYAWKLGACNVDVEGCCDEPQASE